MSTLLSSKRPLGIFDSGVGGLSVLREIHALLPHEDIIYLADAAHVPYGTRPPAEIRSLTEAACTFLVAQGAKALVVACNTASTNALVHLRDRLRVPIIGLVPAVKPAVALTRSGVIGVLATAATARAAALHDVIAHFAVPADVSVLTFAPQGLVEAVERGDADSPATVAILEPCLAVMHAQKADVLVLGCTHFPFLRPLLTRLDPTLTVIDSGEAIARQTARILETNDLCATEPEHIGQLRFYTTASDTAHARQIIAALLDMPLDTVDVARAGY